MRDIKAITRKEIAALLGIGLTKLVSSRQQHKQKAFRLLAAKRALRTTQRVEIRGGVYDVRRYWETRQAQ